MRVGMGYDVHMLKNMETGMLLKELMNASINAATIPEEIFGSTTLKNACALPQPSVQAISSIEKSNCSSAEPTTRMT